MFRNKIRKLRETAQRRRLRPYEQAQLTFFESMEAVSDGPSRALQKAGRGDEDERRVRLCTGENPHRVRADEDDAMKYCPYCGAPMQDEDEAESEGRTGREPDRNDLGDNQPRYHGEDRADITVRSGSKKADEAVKTFKSQYRKARETASFSGSRASAAILPSGF